MSDSKFKNIKIGIVNLKTHNLFSIYSVCKKIGYKVSVIETINTILHFDILILPGVGSYTKGMENINKNGFIEKIYEFTSDSRKFLFCICLGMQLLFDYSTEFKYTKGLGLIKGSVQRLKSSQNFRVPHIGWNKIILNNENKLFSKEILNNKFYFIHSYICKPSKKNYFGTKTIYGKNSFCSS